MHVLQVLRAAFPGQVTPGNKAIKIAPSGTRRSSDVIVAAQYRRYLRYISALDQDYVLSMCLFDTTFNRIVNYPRQHSANCTAKHGATNSWFKPTVRILKNIRRAMVERGLIGVGLAPSYFLEGLLYNAPNEHFGGSYQDTLIAAIKWIIGANRNDFVCANEQYYLLRNSRETWPPVNCDLFLTALVQYWQNWT